MSKISTIIATCAIALFAAAGSASAADLQCVGAKQQCKQTWTVPANGAISTHTQKSMEDKMDLYFSVYANGKALKDLANGYRTNVQSGKGVLATIASLGAGPIALRLVNMTSKPVRFTITFYQSF